MKKNFFFVHGGPGFTSKPEEKLIAPLLKADIQVHFWNELSPLRGNTDLTNYFGQNLEWLKTEMMKQIKMHDTITPIFFSFGFQYLLHLPQEITNRFKKIILIAPSSDYNKTDNNIFNLALNDYQQSNPDNYHTLKKMVSELGASFDPAKEAAFLLAASAPTLFTNYFNSEKAMGSYFEHLAGDYGFSIDSFLAIRRSMPLGVSLKTFQTETIALFGKDDPITPYKDHFHALGRNFPQLICKQFDSHKHFLHIENPQLLLNCFL